MCRKLCNGGYWCPFSCPEFQLYAGYDWRSPEMALRKRTLADPVPPSLNDLDDLDNFSFDEYLFRKSHGK